MGMAQTGSARKHELQEAAIARRKNNGSKAVTQNGDKVKMTERGKGQN